jgi:hypothetical protein
MICARDTQTDKYVPTKVHLFSNSQFYAVLSVSPHMAQHHLLGKDILIIDAPRSYSVYAVLTKQIKGVVYRTRPPVRLSACDVALGCLHNTSHKSLPKSCRPVGASHVKIELVAAVLYWWADRGLKRTFHTSWPIFVESGTQDLQEIPWEKMSFVKINTVDELLY